MAKQAVAEIKKLDVHKATIHIKGITPLIMHRWSEKAKEQMLRKQMKQAVTKAAKDPEEQFEESLYKLDDGRPGFPADAFKKCMVRGAKQLGLTMTDMRTGFFVHGEYSARDDRELVPIQGAVSYTHLTLPTN